MPSTPVLIFDLDGTLIDAFADIAAAINVPLARRGLPTHSVEAVHGFVGEGVGKLVDRATPPSHHHELDLIREEMMVHYRAHGADMATIYPGILPMLEEFKAAGLTMALLTNKPHTVTLATCEHLNISHFFQDIQGPDGVDAPRKPDPKALFDQLERLGKTSAIMIGDGMPDGQVSRAAGIPFVACGYGTRTLEDLAVFSPVAVAAKPEDLHPALKQLLEL